MYCKNMSMKERPGIISLLKDKFIIARHDSVMNKINKRLDLAAEESVQYLLETYGKLGDYWKWKFREEILEKCPGKKIGDKVYPYLSGSDREEIKFIVKLIEETPPERVRDFFNRLPKPIGQAEQVRYKALASVPAETLLQFFSELYPNLKEVEKTEELTTDDLIVIGKMFGLLKGMQPADKDSSPIMDFYENLPQCLQNDRCIFIYAFEESHSSKDDQERLIALIRQDSPLVKNIDFLGFLLQNGRKKFIAQRALYLPSEHNKNLDLIVAYISAGYLEKTWNKIDKSLKMKDAEVTEGTPLYKLYKCVVEHAPLDKLMDYLAKFPSSARKIRTLMLDVSNRYIESHLPCEFYECLDHSLQTDRAMVCHFIEGVAKTNLKKLFEVFPDTSMRNNPEYIRMAQKRIWSDNCALDFFNSLSDDVKFRAEAEFTRGENPLTEAATTALAFINTSDVPYLFKELNRKPPKDEQPRLEMLDLFISKLSKHVSFRERGSPIIAHKVTTQEQTSSDTVEYVGRTVVDRPAPSTDDNYANYIKYELPQIIQILSMLDGKFLPIALQYINTKYEDLLTELINNSEKLYIETLQAFHSLKRDCEKNNGIDAKETQEVLRKIDELRAAHDKLSPLFERIRQTRMSHQTDEDLMPVAATAG